MLKSSEGLVTHNTSTCANKSDKWLGDVLLRHSVHENTKRHLMIFIHLSDFLIKLMHKSKYYVSPDPRATWALWVWLCQIRYNHDLCNYCYYSGCWILIMLTSFSPEEWNCPISPAPWPHIYIPSYFNHPLITTPLYSCMVWRQTHAGRDVRGTNYKTTAKETEITYTCLVLPLL